jgi:hypothetical protein
MAEDRSGRDGDSRSKHFHSGHDDSVYIKPSKRGTFTADAHSHGESVQERASQVLSNKGAYSAATVKKANFARNMAH